MYERFEQNKLIDFRDLREYQTHAIPLYTLYQFIDAIYFNTLPLGSDAIFLDHQKDKNEISLSQEFNNHLEKIYYAFQYYYNLNQYYYNKKNEKTNEFFCQALQHLIYFTAHPRKETKLSEENLNKLNNILFDNVISFKHPSHSAPLFFYKRKDGTPVLWSDPKTGYTVLHTLFETNLLKLADIFIGELQKNYDPNSHELKQFLTSINCHGYSPLFYLFVKKHTSQNEKNIQKELAIKIITILKKLFAEESEDFNNTITLKKTKTASPFFAACGSENLDLIKFLFETITYNCSLTTLVAIDEEIDYFFTKNNQLSRDVHTYLSFASLFLKSEIRKLPAKLEQDSRPALKFNMNISLEYETDEDYLSKKDSKKDSDFAGRKNKRITRELDYPKSEKRQRNLLEISTLDHERELFEKAMAIESGTTKTNKNSNPFFNRPPTKAKKRTSFIQSWKYFY